ncbi:MAG: pseudouridine synthase, partial [Atribacterota bacterium]
LAQMGVESRRKCEKLIIQGKVKVNGAIITELGTKIDVNKDKIEVNSKIIAKKISRIYLILNKPKGFLCTYHDPFGRPTIYDLLKKIKNKLNYAGRLDLNSEGLVFLTNDGELINQITHPKKKIKKVYEVKIKGHLNENYLRQLEKGVPITPIFTTNPCQVKLLKTGIENSLLKISISEGKKRQVRRMLAYLGFQVLELKRTHIGILNMNNLETGQYRFLKREEIKKLKNFLANN